MHRPLPRALSASEIAAHVGAQLQGDGHRLFVRLASLESAQPDSVAFLSGRRHLNAARASRAGAILVSPALAGALSADPVRLLIDDPYLAYARLSQWFEAQTDAALQDVGVHPAAVVDPQASIGEGCWIDAGAVIGAGAHIGLGCRIGAGCSIGAGAHLGAGSVLHPRVTLYPGVTLGARAIVHAGTVIGADGFGFAPSAQGWVKIAQLGSVRIGDDVEIGANCSIDRGALDDTVIGSGCKLDNQVQVGHNVRIGAGTAIAGCVGIAGSAVIGERCMIGGGVGVAGHITLCDGAVIGGMTLVERSIDEPGFYTGAWPLQTHAQWERTAATLKQLPQLRQRLRALASRNGLPKDPS